MSVSTGTLCLSFTGDDWNIPWSIRRRIFLKLPGVLAPELAELLPVAGVLRAASSGGVNEGVPKPEAVLDENPDIVLSGRDVNECPWRIWRRTVAVAAICVCNRVRWKEDIDSERGGSEDL